MRQDPLVVPGAPTLDGTGWRVWYGFSDDSFTPDPPVIKHGTTRKYLKECSWSRLKTPEGIDRNAGVQTVRMKSPASGGSYKISIPELDRDKPFVWKTFPTTMPADGFTFLFSSCFYRSNDREGAFRTATQELSKRFNPHFKFLIGDQIYADVPDFTSTTAPVPHYCNKYEDSWNDPVFRDVLQETPNFMISDDHEFWNNFPEKQSQITWTWRQADRTEHTQAANAFYRIYQRALNPDGSIYYSFTVDSPEGPGSSGVPPVSFFFMDTRYSRDSLREGNDRYPDNSPPRFLGEQQRNAFERWIRNLNGPGILVTGQPLFQEEKNSITDFALQDFNREYAWLLKLIRDRIRGDLGDGNRHDVFVISGDIHTGRFSEGHFSGGGDETLSEFISSPTAHVWGFNDIFGGGTPDRPPEKIRATARHENPPESIALDVQTHETNGIPTLDNNVGFVRVRPGPNGAVRLEHRLYRVRTYDGRSWWDQLTGASRPDRNPGWIYQDETLLR